VTGSGVGAVVTRAGTEGIGAGGAMVGPEAGTDITSFLDS
jgi:hypothetical protein